MKITGNPEDILVSMEGLAKSLPYRLPKSTFIGVSLKKDKDTVYKIFFSDKKKAGAFRSSKKQDVTLIKLPLIESDMGSQVEVVYFIHKICCATYEEHLRKNTLDTFSSPRPTTTSQLESLVDEDFYEDDEDEEELERAFELEFEAKANEARAKAKSLLSNLAKYYLDVDVIDKNEYLKQKLELEEMSLSGLILQMYISEKAIKNLMKMVYMKKGGTKILESLAKLQSIVLDINKCMSSTIKDMTADMSIIKSRHVEMHGEIGSNNVTEESGVVVQTGNVRDAINFVKKNMTQLDQKFETAFQEEVVDEDEDEDEET